MSGQQRRFRRVPSHACTREKRPARPFRVGAGRRITATRGVLPDFAASVPGVERQGDCRLCGEPWVETHVYIHIVALRRDAVLRRRSAMAMIVGGGLWRLTK